MEIIEIIVISCHSLDKWNEENGTELGQAELTDEQFREISRRYDCGWHFDSMEEYVDAFNRDDNQCPVPDSHYIRVVREQEHVHPVLLVLGEFACKEFMDAHKGETHTDKEWKELAEAFRDSHGDGIFTELHLFRTKEEADAFCSGAERLDSYLSSDFYTAITISEGVIYTGETF